MTKAISVNRLPRNFHRTFKPERQYITALLRFAASDAEGDYQAIGAATGIPTGVSTGKVPAIFDYCRAMGLVVSAGSERGSIKRPVLTPFGRIVLLEDPFLKCEVSQWIAHFHLCSPLSGADVWYQAFFAGLPALGMRFERESLESHLSLIYGTERSGLVGPLIGMYEDDAAFRICGALNESSGSVTRKPAPLSDELGCGYGAWILQLMATHFPASSQISVTDLDAQAGCRSIPGWDIGSHQRVLELIERKGMITVDRHMEPWLIHPLLTPENAWKRIYDDLL